MSEKEVLALVTGSTNNYEQISNGLSDLAACSVHMKEEIALRPYVEKKSVYTMGEASFMACPRYILPDYSVLLEKGSEYLGLGVPESLDDALDALLLCYLQVPSVTHKPVFMGRIDKLLEPYVVKAIEKEGEVSVRKKIARFLNFADKSIHDSFFQSNIGPEETVTGNLILDIETERKEAVPGLSLLYDPSITPDSFALKAVSCALSTGKPSFVNVRGYDSLLPYSYALASCYNSLPERGGAYFLCRLNFKYVALSSRDENDFFANELPSTVEAMLSYMDAKASFLHDHCAFFKSNFLVKEGMVDRERFLGMFGIVGVADGANILMEKEGRPGRYGKSEDADSLGERMLSMVAEMVENHRAPYHEVSGGRYLLHAQVGIDMDIDTAPGARIPIGEEIELYDHLRHAARFHPFFPAGTGDIFPFDETWRNNTDGILHIIKSAFSIGLLHFSMYEKNADVIRITGYMVKRSDIEKLHKGGVVLQNNASWGANAVRNAKILERKVR